MTRRSNSGRAVSGAALLYLRQSITDDDAASLSLASQEAILRAMATELGVPVAEPPIRDPDEKGWDETRPGLAELISRAQAPEIGRVLVYDMSRFARSVRIQENSVYALERAGVTVHSHREPFASHPLFRQVLGAIAEEQTRTISGYVRAAMTARVRRGVIHGSIPFGYQRDKTGAVIAHPQTGPIVTELFQRYAAGEPAEVLKDELNARGVPTQRGAPAWRSASVRYILDNPAYLGISHINGEHVAGSHPPLIDRATWERVATRRSGRRRYHKRKEICSWLEGLVWHGCGAPMYLVRPAPKRATSFRCATVGDGGALCDVRPRSAVAATLEQRVRAQLEADLGAALSAEEVLRRAKAAQRAVAPLAERRIREARERLTRAERRRTAAEELYLSGARDRAWFDAQDSLAAAEIAAAERDLATLPEPPARADVLATAKLLRSVAAVIRLAPDERLRAILTEIGTVVYTPPELRIAYLPRFAPFLAPDQETIATV